MRMHCSRQTAERTPIELAKNFIVEDRTEKTPPPAHLKE